MARNVTPLLFDDVLQCAIPTYSFSFSMFFYTNLFLLFLNESGLCNVDCMRWW